MFDKGIIRSMMFLLVILIVACMLAQLSISIETNNDGFFGQPTLNKQVLNIDNQNAIKKAAKVAANAAAKAAVVRQTPQRQATVIKTPQTQKIPPPPTTPVIKTPQTQQIPPPTTPVIKTPQTQQR